eukprot:4389417-Prymnesium_polylepis.2
MIGESLPLPLHLQRLREVHDEDVALEVDGADVLELEEARTGGDNSSGGDRGEGRDYEWRDLVRWIVEEGWEEP